MSKKKIIAIVSIIVLLFAAGISVGVFLYGRGESAAVDGSQVQGTTDQNQQGDGNQSIEGTIPDGNVQDGENDENLTTNPNEGDEQTPGEGNVDGAEDNENANNNAANNNNQAAGNDDNEVTTDTNVNDVGETTITRVEEQERLVSEAFWDWWMPMDVTLTRSNVNVNLPQITVEKRALTPVAGNDFVYSGQEITYVIDVTNNSDVDVEEIEITDKIPENTNFVSMEDIIISEEESVKGTTVTSENEVVGVKWIATIPAKETVSAYFTVKVNDEVTGTISNVAIANGEESKDPTNTPEEGTETKTAIITSNKSSVITRNDEEVQTAKIGDLITYTIQVTNTGDKEGITYITDEIPEGTKFVSAEDEKAIFDEEENIVVWPLTVKPGETVEKIFTVEVTEINGEIENIAYIGEVPTNPDVTDTTGITVNKEVVDVKRNGQSIIDDATTVENVEVKDGDVIEYTITVKNIGSKDLENVNITESLNVDVTKGQLNIGNLAAGEEVVIEVTYTVTYDADIYENDARLINNKVEVTGTTVTEPENEDEKPEDVKDEDETKTDVEEFSKIEIEKTATAVKVLGTEEFEKIVIDPETNEMNIKVRPGDIIEYTILVKNTGNTTLENIKVTDSLKVTVDGVEKDLEEQEDGTMASVIAEILRLSAKAGENVETIKTYYTVVDSDVIEEKPIHNSVKATVPEGTEDSNEEDVPVNPDTSVSGTKTWVDGGKDHDNAKDVKLTLTRTANGKTETVEATPAWEGNTYTFSKLEKYDVEGYEYIYSVSEAQVSGYDIPAQTGNDFTNTITDPSDVTVSGTKTWVDGGKNHDNATEITLTLSRVSAKEGSVAETVEVTPVWEGNTYTFSNLEKYDAEGYEYTYSVSETQVSGYDAPVQSGNNFTNTITDPSNVTVTGTKTWVDGGKPHNNEEDVKLTLTRTANGKTEIVEATLEWNENTYTFSNLEKYDAEGYEYTYSVSEAQVNGYDAPVKSGNNFTNTITDPSNVTVTGTKTWVDGGKQHNNATEITLTLSRTSAKEGSVAETVESTPTWNGSTYTFSGLDKYDEAGYEYTYTVAEKEVEGYTTTVSEDGLNFTNTIIDPKDVTVTGTKTWIDGGKLHNNATEITLTLSRTSAKESSVAETVESTPTWNGSTYTFSGLDKYDEAGYEYTYTVAEKEVEGYTTTVSEDGLNFTNTIVDPMNVTVTGTKTWVDGGDEHDNAKEITLELTRTANGTTETVKVTPEWNGSTYTFSGLDKYDEAGYEYTYAVAEKEVEGYTTTVSEDGLNFTNTIVDPMNVAVTGTKTWVDGGKQHNNANEITLTLSRISAKEGSVAETVEATPEWNGNTYTFSNLEKYDAEGYEYTYSVSEAQVDGYDEPEQTGNDFTNTITDPSDVEVTGTKTWVDGGKQHNNANEITLTLSRTSAKEGSVAETVEVTPEWNGNTYTFSGLEKYDAEGYEYTYSVTETQVNGYDEPAQTGNDFTNTITDPSDVEVTGTKTWVDGGKQHNNANEITLTLTRTANGKTETVAATPTWNGNTYTFSGLDKYDEAGYEYTYSVAETQVSGYDEPEQTGNNFTNTITDPSDVTVSGTKTWVDGGKQHNNANEITLTLTRTANGKTETVAATPTWNGNTYTFSGLDKYDEAGYEYTYSVAETQVDGYDEPEQTGNDFTNTITDPSDVTVTGTKTWVDGGKQHNNANEVTLTLTRTANGTAEIVDVTPEWNGSTYTFSGLEKYDAEGYEYTYSVSETQVDGYDEPVKSGNDFTNTITDPSNVTVSGTKTWVDGGKQHNNANEITLTLSRTSAKDGSVAETLTATPTWNGSTYTFSGLEKYDAEGYEYTYSVSETQVDGYDEPVKSGNDFTNTITDPSNVTVSGTKTWVDGGKEHNNANEITLTLSRISVKEGSVAETLTATPTWNGNTYTFSGLDKYDEEGYEYTYSVSEEPVSGYKTTSIKTDNGVNFTNKITGISPISVKKEWENVSEENIPESIDVQIYANGNAQDNFAELSETNNWTYTWDDLEKYDDQGKEIDYSVKEIIINVEDGTVTPIENNGVNGEYIVTYEINGDLTTITNTLTKPEIIVTKIQDREIDEKIKYGDEITYTITAENKGNAQGNVTIKDSIPNNSELYGKITITQGGNSTEIEPTDLEEGYLVTLGNDGSTTDIAVITFKVKVTGYSGDSVTNTAQYQVEGEPEKSTETECKVDIEDDSKVIPTTSNSSSTIVPQKVILVLDFSASMDDKIDGVKKITSLRSAVSDFLTNFLDGNNEVMIITYSQTVSVTQTWTKSKDTAYGSIENKRTSSGTNIDGALTKANEYVSQGDTNTSVILMTDGWPGYYIENLTGRTRQSGDGWSYNEKSANEAIESAGWIKDKGIDLYSIGFGLEGNNVETFMAAMASETVGDNKYYFKTSNADELNAAFDTVYSSVTECNDGTPIPLDTENGILTITSGFVEGQNVEIYTGQYVSKVSTPTYTYSWDEFVALTYVSYEDSTISFNLGQYMKDKSMLSNETVTVRFVDPVSNTSASVASVSVASNTIASTRRMSSTNVLSLVMDGIEENKINENTVTTYSNKMDEVENSQVPNDANNTDVSSENQKVEIDIQKEDSKTIETENKQETETVETENKQETETVESENKQETETTQKESNELEKDNTEKETANNEENDITLNSDTVKEEQKGLDDTNKEETTTNFDINKENSTIPLTSDINEENVEQ